MSRIQICNFCKSGFPFKRKESLYCNKKCYFADHKRPLIQCNWCGDPFTIKYGKRSMFCSFRCSSLWKHTHLVQMKVDHKGSKSGNWKGDDVGYVGIHLWIRKTYGTPTRCELCHKHFSGRNINWANKTGKYLRNRNDWMRLCSKCHGEYDRENGLRGNRNNRLKAHV